MAIDDKKTRELSALAQEQNNKASESDIRKFLLSLQDALAAMRSGDFSPLDIETLDPDLCVFKNKFNETIRSIRSQFDRFEYVLEGAGLGAWDWWLESNEVSFDRRWSEMLGLTVDETLPHLSTWENRVHSDDKVQAYEDIKAYLDGKTEVYENIHRMRHQNGSWVWILDRGRVSQRDAAGKPIRFTGVHLDITRYKNEEALSNNIQKIGRIGAWEMDLATQQTHWTTEMYRLHGLPVMSPLDSKQIIDFKGDHEQIKFDQCVKDCIEGRRFGERLDFVDAKGFRKCVEVTGEPVFDAHDRIIKIRGTLQDVSAHARIVARLDQALIDLQKYRIWIENAREGVWEIDAYGITTYVNSTMSLLLGYRVDEIIGKSYFSFVDFNWREIAEMNLSQSFSGRIDIHELKFETKSGEPLWVNVSALPQTNAQGQLHSLVAMISDIRLIKQRELQITETKNRFETILNHLPLMIGFYRDQGVFQWVNNSWTQELGWTVPEMTDKDMLSEFYPDSKAKNLVLEMMVKSNGTWREFFTRGKGGSLIHTAWTYVRLADGNSIGIGQNITERKRLEAKARQILDAVNKSAIVTITDAQGIILEANENFCTTSGYAPEEVVGQTHRLVNSGFHSKEFFRRMWADIAQGKTWSGEICNRKKNGDEYWVQSVITPVMTHEQTELILAIRFDVSQQKEAQRLLEEAQRVAKIGSWTYDLSTQKISWSDQMFDLFPEDRLKGPPSFEGHYATIHPEDQEFWKKTVSHCLETGKAYKMRFRTVDKGGNVKWIEAFGEAKRGVEGNVVSLGGTCQDISELVRVEEEVRLERAKALQSAKLASLGEMSAGIAHEINNPLAIIAGHVGNLHKSFEDPEKMRKKISTIQKAVERITKIVGGLRKFSRTSDKSQMTLHEVRGIIDDALLMTSAKASALSVGIEVRCSSKLAIYCDGIEVEQVLVNLINNGIDAVKDLAEKWILIESYSENMEVVLRIKDAGRGIAEKNKEKIFQPFFTTKPVGEGTGLGLAVVKGILDEHGATIALLKDEIHTCFEIRFKSKEIRDVA